MDWSGTFSIPESKSLVYISRMRNVTVLVYFALLTKSFYSLIIYRSSQKKTLHVFKSIFWRNVIEILQNFERVLWNHILVNIPNFKSTDAKLKSYAEISCARLITIPAKNENFNVKKWFQVFFFGQASSDYKKIVIQWFHKN